MMTEKNGRIDPDRLRKDIIRKAWDDESFKQRLMADPMKTIRDEFGIEIPEGHELLVVEETPTRHVLVIPPRPEDVADIQAAPNAYWW